MTSLLALLGTGMFGVGILNGSYGAIHALLALLTFVSGGLSAIIISYRMLKYPTRFVFMALGMISLGSLIVCFLAVSAFEDSLGTGGVERWVSYPIVLWLLGMGGYLAGKSNTLPDQP